MLDIVLRKVQVEGQQVDVGIAGDTIVQVEPEIEERGCREIDGQNRVAITGFVDCHLHLDKVISWTGLLIRM